MISALKNFQSLGKTGYSFSMEQKRIVSVKTYKLDTIAIGLNKNTTHV